MDFVRAILLVIRNHEKEHLEKQKTNCLLRPTGRKKRVLS